MDETKQKQAQVMKVNVPHHVVKATFSNPDRQEIRVMLWYFGSQVHFDIIGENARTRRVSEREFDDSGKSCRGVWCLAWRGSAVLRWLT
jgi:hypothetical protein